MSSPVLVLGAGFSREISREMPLMEDLCTLLDTAIPPALRTDFEMALTYLCLRHPWKTTEQTFSHRAMFERISTDLASSLRGCEADVTAGGFPEWASRLANWLLEHNATKVITFNYDTLLERLLKGMEKSNVEVVSYYGLPLLPVRSRLATLPLGPREARVRILKLHGSTNWLYSGPENPSGQQVWYRPMVGGGQEDARWPEAEVDLLPLIVPPIAEKSGYFTSRLMGVVWLQALQALREADVIYSLGCSMPDSDLTTRQLFAEAVQPPPKKVIVANTDRTPRLQERYGRAFPGCELVFLQGERPILTAVNELTSIVRP